MKLKRHLFSKIFKYFPKKNLKNPGAGLLGNYPAPGDTPQTVAGSIHGVLTNTQPVNGQAVAVPPAKIGGLRAPAPVLGDIPPGVPPALIAPKLRATEPPTVALIPTETPTAEPTATMTAAPVPTVTPVPTATPMAVATAATNNADSNTETLFLEQKK